MLVEESLKKNSNSIYYLLEYHRYWLPDGNVNPSFNKDCGLVLDLKNMKPPAIEYFFNILNPVVYTGVTLCYVPSSDPEKITTGIRMLASKLATQHNRVDGTSCLVRHTKIPKLATGGNRDTLVHFNSVNVQNTHLIVNKPIILLDDVTTSNNSLISHKQLLLNAGAKKVECLSIAQTV